MTGSFWMPPIAFGLTIVTLYLLLRRGWAVWLAIDTPNVRSLHAAPVPRVGGVVMIPAALASALAFSAAPKSMLALAAGLCAVSFIDDRWGLPVALRLLAHIAAATVLGQSLLSSLPSWGLGLAVLALVWAINLFNFMDGTDGLAGGMALFGFAVLAVVMLDKLPGMADLALCLAAAAAGFLVFNFSPAKVFMGDAGSVPLGFLAGGAGLVGWSQEAWPGWFPLLVFSPFVVDASVTLMRRLVRREKIWQAHRDHYYQRVVRMGWSHRRLALVEYLLMAACGISAIGLLQTGPFVQVMGLAGWAVTYAALMLFIDRRWADNPAARGDRA